MKQYIYLILLLLLFSCGDDDSNGTINPNIPSPVNPNDTISNPNIIIQTVEVTSVTGRSAISGGIITDDGGNLITQRGVCWSENPDPTILDNKTTDGQGAGTFESLITGLQELKQYYYRSYAKNSDGINYGSQLVFTTPRQERIEALIEGTLDGEEISFLMYDTNMELTFLNGFNFRGLEFDTVSDLFFTLNIFRENLNMGNYVVGNDSASQSSFYLRISDPEGSFDSYYSVESGDIMASHDADFVTINFNVSLEGDFQISNGIIVYKRN